MIVFFILLLTPASLIFVRFSFKDVANLGPTHTVFYVEAVSICLNEILWEEYTWNTGWAILDMTRSIKVLQYAVAIIEPIWKNVPLYLRYNFLYFADLRLIGAHWDLLRWRNDSQETWCYPPRGFVLYFPHVLYVRHCRSSSVHMHILCMYLAPFLLFPNGRHRRWKVRTGYGSRRSWVGY